MTNLPLSLSHWRSPRSYLRSLQNLRKGRDWKRGKLLMPNHASKLVTRLFSLINKEQEQVTALAKKSGVSANTILYWRQSKVPKLDSFEAAVNALGYELKIVPRSDRPKKYRVRAEEALEAVGNACE